MAAGNNELALMQLLIASGADVNIPDKVCRGPGLPKSLSFAYERTPLEFFHHCWLGADYYLEDRAQSTDLPTCLLCYLGQWVDR
jgi:hypothetical protein